jgi:hypothetical protein
LKVKEGIAKLIWSHNSFGSKSTDQSYNSKINPTTASKHLQSKGYKSTMMHESKMDEPEAGASRNNKKISSEDDTNTNDAPLNFTGSPTTDLVDEVWDVVRVFEDPNDACDCRHEECKSKAVVVWATTSDLTDECPLCEECQELDFGGWPETITPPKHIQSKVNNEGKETRPPKEAADIKELVADLLYKNALTQAFHESNVMTSINVDTGAVDHEIRRTAWRRYEWLITNREMAFDVICRMLDHNPSLGLTDVICTINAIRHIA